MFKNLKALARCRGPPVALVMPKVTVLMQFCYGNLTNPHTRNRQHIGYSAHLTMQGLDEKMPCYGGRGGWSSKRDNTRIRMLPWGPGHEMWSLGPSRTKGRNWLVANDD
jgi:hypothetical protein